MNKGNIFVDRKVMAVCISLLIALIGFICLKTLPIEQYPDIAPPTVMITTSYTGADANTVMKSVVMPIEEAVNGVENMAYMTSEASATGEVSINVFFKQGTDPDMAAVNVQNRVSAALGLLPQEVTRVGVKVEKRQNNILQIAALVSRDGKFDNDFIANYIDINVKPRLLRVTGVGAVQNLGNTYSLRIWMKPDVMAQYNLEPQDIFAAIGNQNMVAATGSLGEQSGNTYQYNLEYKGRLQSIEEFESIVLRTSDGNVLHLRDVADVELGALSYSFSSKVDGQPGVAFIINQAPGANATQVNAAINELYDDIKENMPAGMEFTILQTSDDFLYAAIHNVVETLIIAIILVILVVYFFLQNFKATLIPSISIIVSLLGTFAVVKVAGFSLNILTLFALVLAIGTVVDDAIVVVEAVMAKMESGYTSAYKATKDAMSEVTVAVISCTLVFMAVFIPVTFMPGTSGTFFTQFGITIASSVGLSCISALTLCPALTAVLFRPKKEAQETQHKGLNYWVKSAYEAGYNAILGKYKNGVTHFLQKPGRAWLWLLAAVIAMVFAMRSLPAGLVPQEDQGVIMVDVTAPAGSPLVETDKIMAQVEEHVLRLEEVESYAKISGFGLLSGTGVSYGTLVIRLKPWDERKGYEHYIDYVMGKLYLSCEDIKDAQIIPFQMPQIPGYGNSNAIDLQMEDLQGGDMTHFNEVVNTFLAELQKRPEVQMAMSLYSESFPKYKVDVNATQCDRAGISPDVVLNTLGAYCGSAYISNFNQYGKVYRVMAGAAPEYRLDPNSLNNIFVKLNDQIVNGQIVSGKMAPISQFVTLIPAVGSATQKRFNLYQSIACSVQPNSGYSEGDVQKVIAEVAKEHLPTGYAYEYGGMSRELEANSKSNLTALIYLVCVLLIYMILASLYESFFIPLAVLLSVPFGLMGSFAFSWLCGQENNIYLQTGVIMLIGLLAKTAILITEFAVEKRKQGMPILQAALSACEDRLRPILMTVVTMIAGMIPLIIEGGAGANGNRALAIGVTGGMAVGTLALVFVVPAFYIIFQMLHERFQGGEKPVNEDTETSASQNTSDAPHTSTPVSDKKNKITTVLVLGTLTLCTLFPSCGVFKRYEAPQQPEQDSIVTAVSEADWQTYIEDPVLQGYIKTALANNVDYRSRQLAIREADARLRAAKLGFLPTLAINTANVGVSGTVTPGSGTSGAVLSYQIPLALNWGGEGLGTITNRKRQAQVLREQADDNLAAAHANLVATMARVYTQLQLLDYQATIIDSTELIWQRVLEVQRVLVKNGQAYSPSVGQMEASLINVQIQRKQLLEQINSLELTMCQLMNEEPHSVVRSPWTSYEFAEWTLEPIPATQLSNRADVRAAERNVAAAFYQTNMAKAAFCPALSLSGLLGWTNNGGVVVNPGQLLMNAVLGLAQPIFAGGKLKANLQVARLEQEEAANRYVETMLRAGREVNDAIFRCRNAQEQDALYRRLLATQSDAYNGTCELMKKGKATYLEVLTAQEAYLKAQLADVTNRYNGMISLIDLYIALGGGTK
ncbi:MAG: efflux RND transporter permease subunit [Paludibacteraceae bacterium]|nr:efflux RND transporter permease subunit [Paludibacteraceae bacterium]